MTVHTAAPGFGGVGAVAPTIETAARGRPRPRLTDVRENPDGTITVSLDSAQDPTFWLEVSLRLTPGTQTE